MSPAILCVRELMTIDKDNSNFLALVHFSYGVHCCFYYYFGVSLSNSNEHNSRSITTNRYKMHLIFPLSQIEITLISSFNTYCYRKIEMVLTNLHNSKVAESILCEHSRSFSK